MAKLKRSSGSFVVNITPPSVDGEFFGVMVIRRQQTREHGAIALEKKPLLMDGLSDPPTGRQLDSLAKGIGRAILDGTPQTQRWIAKTRTGG